MADLRLSGGELYIPSAEIADRTRELGSYYREKYGDEDVVMLTVLNGASVFAMDLGRAIGNPRMQQDYVKVETMDGTESAKKPSLQVKWRQHLLGRHVLLVEDIYHTGKTLDYLIPQIRNFDPASLAVVAALNKPTARDDSHTLDCDDLKVGFDVVDEYVIGYGLDLNGEYRFLPHVTKVRENRDGKLVPAVIEEPRPTPVSITPRDFTLAAGS